MTSENFCPVPVEDGDYRVPTSRDQSLAAAFRGPDPKPSTEGGMGRPKARGRSRARTHRSTWAELHARKGGPCRTCGSIGRTELHHLLSKARGGPNEAWNLCSLCPDCHLLVTNEDGATLRLLAERLTDEEYAGLVEHSGETVFERLFHVEYRRPA